MFSTSGKIRKAYKGEYVNDMDQYAVYADKTSGAWINSEEEYKNTYQEKCEATIATWTTYNKMRNTLLWRLLLNKYDELEPLDIVNAYKVSDGIWETIQTLDEQTN